MARFVSLVLVDAQEKEKLGNKEVVLPACPLHLPARIDGFDKTC